MKKYFVTSDIHSFYTPLKKGLSEAGFDKKNPNHILIVCGDVFDRGKETMKVYRFLKYLLKRNRVVLVQGNHELLYQELLDSDGVYYHQFTNGTFGTFDQICGEADVRGEDGGIDWFKIRETVRNSEVTKFILNKDLWVNFFETKDYVFVHSFVPYRDDGSWREASEQEWEKAKWCNPINMKLAGLWKEKKTLVCGHWHAKDFHRRLGGDLSHATNETYIGDRIIALDACTVLSGKVNVFVFEQEEE